ALMETGQLRQAKISVQQFLEHTPTDLAALRLLAEIAARQSRFQEAEDALSKCLRIAPADLDLVYAYVNILLEGNKSELALVEIEKVLKREPRNPVFRGLKAIVLEGLEDYAAAAALWRELSVDQATAVGWLRCGQDLR